MKAVKICETEVTVDDVEAFMLKSLGLARGASRIVECRSKRIGVGQGFLSHICQLGLRWQPALPRLPDRLVLKVPTVQSLSPLMQDMMAGESEQDRAQITDNFQELMLPMAHAQECRLYEYMEAQGGAPLPVPKVYHTRPISKDGPGLIAMEDFSAPPGCRTVDVFTSYRLDQLFSITESLADLHAFCLNDPAWAPHFPDPAKDMYKDFEKMLTGSLAALGQMDPENFPEDKLDEFREVVFVGQEASVDYIVELGHCFEAMGHPPVMVHGDLWSNNILFRPAGEAGTEDEVLAVIDWQGAHAGNPVEDLLRVLLSSTSTALRRRYWKTLLRHYYSRLEEKLVSESVPFPFEDLVKAYEFVFPWSFMMVAFGLPIMAGPKSPMLAAKADPEAAAKELLGRGGAALDDLIELKRAGKLWPKKSS